MEKSVIVLCLLSLFGISSGAPMSCPEAEDLTPCNCKRLAFGLHVTCTNFVTNSDLIRVFKILRSYEIQSLLLHDLNSNEILPKDLFSGMDIMLLIVQKSKLNFPEPAFTGLEETLQILNVRDSKIKTSENFTLATFNNLIELSIKTDALGTVADKWLNGKIPYVRKVTLDENDIEVIEDNAFATLQHLSSISLAENRIKELKRSMFPRPATQLSKLDLSGNKIENLPNDFFLEMPKLTEVILSGNDLKTLDQATWSVVWEQLNMLILFENNLVCDNNLDWLRKQRWPNLFVGDCLVPSTETRKELKEIYRNK